MSTPTPTQDAPKKRSVFRSKALQRHLASRDKTILPRFVAPPVFAFFWALLILLVALALVAWFGEIPVYAVGSGTILQPGGSQTAKKLPEALLLISTESVSSTRRLELGAAVEIFAEDPSSQQKEITFKGSVIKIEPEPLKPEEVSERFSMTTNSPVYIVIVQVENTEARKFASKLVQAQVQIGTMHLLALFPVFDIFLKDV